MCLTEVSATRHSYSELELVKRFALRIRGPLLVLRSTILEYNPSQLELLQSKEFSPRRKHSAKVSLHCAVRASCQEGLAF